MSFCKPCSSVCGCSQWCFERLTDVLLTLSFVRSFVLLAVWPFSRLFIHGMVLLIPSFIKPRLLNRRGDARSISLRRWEILRASPRRTYVCKHVGPTYLQTNVCPYIPPPSLPTTHTSLREMRKAYTYTHCTRTEGGRKEVTTEGGRAVYSRETCTCIECLLSL